MPGTITDEIEIIDAGRGGGTDVPAGGDDDGDGLPAVLPAIPQRAYFTAIQLGTCRHRHVFHGADQFVSGAQRAWETIGWHSAFPRVLWVNTLILLASSVTIQVARTVP